MPSKSFAEVELEVTQDSSEIAPFLSFVDKEQMALLISAPRWFIDRTGLGIKPVATQSGKPFPHFARVVLLGDSQSPQVDLLLPRHPWGRTVGDRPTSCRVDLPALGAYSEAGVSRGNLYYTFTMRTEKLATRETASALSRVVCLVPQFIITNSLERSLFIRQHRTQGPTFEVPPNESRPVVWSTPELRLQFEFRPGLEDGFAWSGPIVASEETAGEHWLALMNGRTNRPSTFLVEVNPDRGVRSVAISTPSKSSSGFVLVNKCRCAQAVSVKTFHPETQVQGATGTQLASPDFDCFFLAEFNQTVHFGWQFPFSFPSRMIQVLVWIDNVTIAPRTPLCLPIDEATFRFKRYEINIREISTTRICVHVGKRGNRTVVEIRSRAPPGSETVMAPSLSVIPEPQEEETEEETSVRYLIKLSQVGVSFVSDNMKEELLFAELSQLLVVFVQKGSSQRFEVSLMDIQMDTQLESAEKPVLLANRGGAVDPNEDGNDSGGQKQFLHVYVERPHAQSKDWIFRRVCIAVDDLEIEIDANMLNGLNSFFDECSESFGIANSSGVTLMDVGNWVGTPFHENYTPPPVPKLITLECLTIEKFTLVVWCSFVLEKMHMLSDLLRMGLRIVMVSSRLELKGAPISLGREVFEDIRGSVPTFLVTLQDKYVHSILACLVVLLGHSSLVNIPRIPLELGRNTIGLAANAVDNVSSGLGSIISNLTFDAEYINRRQRERTKSVVGTGGLRDGFWSAGKNLGEGVMSLTNIVTKPLEGAQKEGVGGFVKGIGKGLAGSIFKPFDKVGQAVSDVTRGIRAEVSKPLGGTKCRATRRRTPRMLWGEYGQLKEYDKGEAELRDCLGLRLAQNVMKCITIQKQETKPATHLALLFYPKRVFYVDLYGNRGSASQGEGESGAYKIWKVSIPEISEIRASSHGVIIRTPNRAFQVTTSSATLIRQIHHEFVASQYRINSIVEIGVDLSQQYVKYR
eukprot:GHVQ01022793.1.p1 GENE.GHVQ01022793.1~~GHVQ01022793.1.p1  ORF type:complete len:974 (+),score=57.45 GHVQ01022793.1:182-3103(+)